MKPRLVFTAGDSSLELIIRAGSLSPASHVAIGLYGANGPLLHAYGKGVCIDSRAAWFGDHRQTLVAEYEIIPDVQAGLQNCFAQVGKPYDLAGAVKIGLLRALHKLGAPIQTLGPASINAFTCAQFVMLLDPLGARICEWQRVNPKTLAPGDLLRVVSSQSFALR